MAHVHIHSEDKYQDSRVPDLVECEGELIINPELDNWELSTGDYAYPCAECQMLTIVQDPYDFDETDHVCGRDSCDAGIVRKVA